MFSAVIKLSAACLICAAFPAFSQTAPGQVDPYPVISQDGSLYRVFGGHDGLVAITDDMMANTLNDPRTHDFFVAANRERLKAGLVEIFCHVLGGGCIYTGRDMKSVHAQLGVREEDFLAVVESLQKAMDKHHVPFWAQNRLLAAMAPQHRDIVTGAGKG